MSKKYYRPIKLSALAIIAYIIGVALLCFAAPDVSAEAAAYDRDANPPIITLSPANGEGYVREVSVTIAWDNENSYKYYSVKSRTGEETGEIKYTRPFTITAEGNNEIRAYYYDAEGAKRTATAKVDYVDVTPPNDATIAESIRVEVDLTSTVPMRLVLRARDVLSGVKRVYVKDLEREFELIDPLESLYAVDCKGLMDGVNLVAEDNAGNYCQFAYSLAGYDRAAIEEYSNMYRALDRSAYALDALDRIDAAYAELSNIMEYVDADSSSVAAYKRAVNDAIRTDCVTEVVYASTGDSIPTGMDIEVKYGDTDCLAGDRLVLRVGALSVNEFYANDNTKTAIKISGYMNPIASPFSLSLTGTKGTPTMYREVKISFNMPLVSDIGKVYYDNGGALELCSSEIVDGRLVFYTKGFGDFYFISDNERTNSGNEVKGLTIGDRFYPASTLGIVGGIIGGIMILGGVVTFIGLNVVSKRSSKK